MSFEDAINIAYESTTHSMHQSIYSTQEKYFDCPICAEEHGENSDVWRKPHLCADLMSSDNQWVCSEACAEKWCVINFEEIDEFEGK